MLRQEYLLENIFTVDFYMPEARLVFEVNGKTHFYPMTYRQSNATKYKSKLLRQFGQGSHRMVGSDRNFHMINLNT